jgi:microcystin-dependent protein
MAWTTPSTWSTDQLVTATDLNTELRDNFIAVLPIATYILRAAAYTSVETAVESRWLQCNGAEVSRTTYSALFAYLNSLSPALPFGVGNGSTTFTLPDLRGRAAWAEGEHTDIDSMGESDGAVIANRRPKHYHLSQYGNDSLGGTIPTAASAGESAGKDTNVDWTYATTPGATNNLLDGPAYLVVGSWFIKYN